MKALLSFLKGLFVKKQSPYAGTIMPQLSPEESGLVWLEDNIRPSSMNGKVIIACPNEWCSMHVGRVIGEIDCGLLVIREFISKSTAVVCSPWVLYSSDELKALCVLNPYERYNKIAKHTTIDTSKPKSGIDEMTFEDYMQAIYMDCLD